MPFMTENWQADVRKYEQQGTEDNSNNKTLLVVGAFAALIFLLLRKGKKK